MAAKAKKLKEGNLVAVPSKKKAWVTKQRMSLIEADSGFGGSTMSSSEAMSVDREQQLDLIECKVEVEEQLVEEYYPPIVSFRFCLNKLIDWSVIKILNIAQNIITFSSLVRLGTLIHFLPSIQPSKLSRQLWTSWLP